MGRREPQEIKERKETKEQMVAPGLKVCHSHCFFQGKKGGKGTDGVPGSKGML
jgi:predicted amidohydrolase